MKQLIFSLALVGACAANAQNAPWVVQVGIGQLSTSLAVTGSDVKTDTSPTTKSISVGYGLSRVFALSVGYRDFGAMRAYRNTGDDQFSASIKANAYTLGLVAALPLTDKLVTEISGGAYRGTYDIYSSERSRFTEKVTKAYFGAGLSYAMNQKIAVGINWTRFKSPAKAGFDSPDAYEAVLKYKF